MAFNDQQREALQAKLNIRHVRSRISNGVEIPYVEGWHVIAEANRIFGHDGWDRKTISPRCIWRDTQRGQTSCLYTAKVRITVTAGDSTVIRDGIGTGAGRAPSPELAHEIALKAAETDATKRALATFGNPFGLALYDKERSQVTRSRRTKSSASTARAGTDVVPSAIKFDLVHIDGRRETFPNPETFVEAVLKVVPTLDALAVLYAFWDANRAALEALQRAAPDGVETIITALKTQARTIGRSANPPSNEDAGSRSRPPALLVPKEKRVRSKAHLVFVAQQPCLVCGRRPAHAHHLRFAQSRAMGLKVSDEFTLPLCAGHHDSVHKTGDERAWWARHGIIEPLKYAARLWTASRLDPGPNTVIDGEATTDA